MKFFLFVLLFFSQMAWGKLRNDGRLPLAADDSIEYVAARDALAMAESGKSVCIKNKVSSASGKYQFMRAWNPFFLKSYGRTWASAVPVCASSGKIKLAMGKHQDRMFDIYYDTHVGPFLVKARKIPGWNDIELLALYHRQGEAGAWKYLRTNKDYANGKWGNGPVKVHIARVIKNVKYPELIAKR